MKLRVFGPKTDYENWSITDVLAAYRTKLANERTVLAYGRTALTLFVAGVTFIQFFDSPIIEGIGWAFVPLGLITFAIGVFRYNREKYRIHQLGKRNGRMEQ
jgi:putative membrane protein